ncbi:MULTISPECIES: hypothetical protein [Sporomusa]|jgi:hypothetical protein|uniref:Uncharacterized protein n=2 Tax=Sporomusa TaxID=2375 RepID=A0ABM9W381_9FIRM|nr:MULTISPECIES: hypothetical protein [Sporomusa]SCM80163.1 conserved hypothetical protein [uncultured Sporomusa sp.]MCM0757240.1 hypothetical protein [Sporomusa sphaeroides DSM 2875]OLS58475.1 hypothetical protein SPSPH_20230 [Sporomusa sphaeroides DSM 2875]CVK19615.1 hypothetical protein SSPH_02270 [Sporomusa sphaeroides DSM 2875]HML34301.1 hypothetical protein [Sporomusa sphaeroides]
MTTCPVCGRHGIGKVGADQYYCWDCCVEFMVRNQDVKIFNVEADGTLTLYEDLLQGTVNLEVQKG